MITDNDKLNAFDHFPFVFTIERYPLIVIYYNA